MKPIILSKKPSPIVKSDITTESKRVLPPNTPKPTPKSEKLRTNDVLTESEYKNAVK